MLQKSRYALALLTCATVALMGCSTASETTDAGTTGKTGSGSGSTASKPAPKQNVRVQVPSGSTMTVALDQALSTETNKAGDRFAARTTQAIVVDQRTVFPAGSKVTGTVTHVEEPHRTAGKAEMTLAFEQIVDASGKTHSIGTEPLVLIGQGDKISDEEKVAGGAVIGGIIGALTSKDKAKGAATGAVAGGVAGGAIAIATKGPQLVLPAGQQFSVELTRSVEVQIASN